MAASAGGALARWLRRQECPALPEEGRKPTTIRIYGERESRKPSDNSTGEPHENSNPVTTSSATNGPSTGLKKNATKPMKKISVLKRDKLFSLNFHSFFIEFPLGFHCGFHCSSRSRFREVFPRAHCLRNFADSPSHCRQHDELEHRGRADKEEATMLVMIGC